MEYLDGYDFIFLFLGIVVRFGAMIKKKVDEFDEDFNFVDYFDKRHAIRWLMHLFVSVLALFILPELFLDLIVPNFSWLEKVKTWGSLGSAMAGFIGYDFIKLFEKAVVTFAGKIGVKI